MTAAFNPAHISPGNERVVGTYVWDTGTLAWVPQTSSGGSSGPSSDVTVTNSSIAVTQAGAWTVGVTGTFWQATQPVSGPLTDAQLRATSVPVAKSKTALSASAPATATVGTSSAQAVAANASRKGLVLTNLSANTISFGLGATAVLNSGITLTPNGVWVMDDYTFSVAAINAIASGAGSALAVQELT